MAGQQEPTSLVAPSKRPEIAVPPGLHVVATPIGNLGDMTLRAIAVLRKADVIACEDTRVTAKLRVAFEIATPMIAYHEHNAARMRPMLIERLKRGETVALVSDAGTPLISDPGYRLVRAARDAGIGVIAAPGPSAVLAALAVSGQPTDRFLFAGFPPTRIAARRDMLAGLRGIEATLVLFEAPHRLAGSLADMADVLGPRDAAICRELTKRPEEIRRGTLSELAAAYSAEGSPRGEIVVVIAPPPEQGGGAAPDDAALDAMLREALGRLGTRDAAAEVAARTGLKRRALYARALALSRGDADGGPG
jgi:16S rRNA (cytidine1402-2'-O)-methyltransferase